MFILFSLKLDEMDYVFWFYVFEHIGQICNPFLIRYILIIQ